MVALTAAIALAASAVAPRIAITNVSVIDVVNGAVRKDVTVLLSGGTINAIGKSVPAQHAQVVDGSGKFLIPGLWDMHAHCCNADDHFFPLFLANGVTGIRDMADPVDELKTCRSNIEAEVLLGPRMVFCGQIIDGPKPCHPDISIAVGTPEEGRKAVETVQREGVDFLKVYSFLPRDAYFAIADEAKRRHMVFAGHVPNEVTAKEASNAGQKSFEHLMNVLEGCSGKEAELLADAGSILRARHIQIMVDSYDDAKAEALFRSFHKNGTWQCPTLTVLNSLLQGTTPGFRNDPRLPYLPEDIVSFWNPMRTNVANAEDFKSGQVLFRKYCDVVGKMATAGVGILAGTDTPNRGAFPGFGVHDELAFLVESGLSTTQALQTATINPARYFGWEKKMGTVQVGKVADLVLLDANPLDDIHNTTRINAVFVRGRYLNRTTLDQLLRKSGG